MTAHRSHRWTQIRKALPGLSSVCICVICGQLLFCSCACAQPPSPEPGRPPWAEGLEPCDCSPPADAGPLDVDHNHNVEDWDYWRVWICCELAAGKGVLGDPPDCSLADVTGDGAIDAADLAAYPAAEVP